MSSLTPIATDSYSRFLKTVLLRRKEVEQVTGLCRSSIYALIAKGEFPKPVRLGSMSVAWASSEIDAWISERLAQREVA